MYWAFSLWAMSKARWIAFTSENWLDSPCHSAVSATCVGLHTAALHLWCFPKIWQNSPGHIVFHFPVFHLQWGFFSPHHLLFWQYSKIFASQPVNDNFQNSWATGISYSSALCDQCTPLTPHSISCMMCRTGSPFEYPAKHWQSGCQEELFFNTNHVWSSSNSFIWCQYLFFSWSIAGLESSVSLMPKPWE